jgi:hypothetical protein
MLFLLQEAEAVEGSGKETAVQEDMGQTGVLEVEVVVAVLIQAPHLVEQQKAQT